MIGMRKSMTAAAMLAAFLLIFAGTWAIASEIGPVSAPLEPMTNPKALFGTDKTVWQVNTGHRFSRKVKAMDETTISYRSSDGCIETYLCEGFFPYPI